MSGNPKDETGEEHKTVIETTLKATASEEELLHARVVSVSSDGEKRRHAALVALTFKVILSVLSVIFEYLGCLALMCLWVGDDDLTADKDYKHVFKRLRNTILRSKGIFVRGCHLTPAVIQAHLRDSGHSTRHIQSMFKPEDKQDVLLAYNLLRDLWSLPPASSSESSRPGYAETREAIRIYGDICYHLVIPYICVDLTLAEQLEHLSSAAHLALALYEPGDRLMPTTLFTDIMMMVKNAYFCVAKAKVDHPDDPFFLVLLGTDRLETLFGILRTMVGNDANLDILQLSLRVTGTTEVANILALHPEWDKAPRRLHLPLITRDMESIPDAADHANPGLWRGEVKPALVSLVTCWKQGRRVIEHKYRWTSEVLQRTEAIPGATILAPQGTLLVRLPLAPDDNEDDGEGPEPSSEAPEPSVEDTTDGLRELEDAAAEVDLDLGSSTALPRQPFPKFVQINGVMTSKARALSQRFKYKKTSTSTDRLRRVASESKYKLSADDNDGLVDDEGPQLTVNDPISTLLECEGKLFLCIGEVKGIFVHSKPVDSVPISLLPEKAVAILYQIVRLTRTTVDDDPTKDNDWRSSLFLSATVRVPGLFVQPINPTVSTRNPGNPCFLFDSDSLMALTASLHDRFTDVQLRAIPHIARTAEYPYRERTGM